MPQHAIAENPLSDDSVEEHMLDSERRTAQETEGMEKDELSGLSKVNAEWSSEGEDVNATDDTYQDDSTTCGVSGERVACCLLNNDAVPVKEVELVEHTVQEAILSTTGGAASDDFMERCCAERTCQNESWCERWRTKLHSRWWSARSCGQGSCG